MHLIIITYIYYYYIHILLLHTYIRRLKEISLLQRNLPAYHVVKNFGSKKVWQIGIQNRFGGETRAD